MPCISVVSKIVNEISDYLGVSTDDNIGFKNKFDETYFDKIEAIEYSLKHDDGQILEDLDEADIILIGPMEKSWSCSDIANLIKLVDDKAIIGADGKIHLTEAQAKAILEMRNADRKKKVPNKRE